MERWRGRKSHYLKCDMRIEKIRKEESFRVNGNFGLVQIGGMVGGTQQAKNM